MWPLDVSAGIPKESGMRWAFLAHHSMELTAHSFPAPRRFLLEALELLIEWFLSHTCGLKGGAGSHQIGIQEEGFQEMGIFGSTHVEGPGLVERVQEVRIFRNANLKRGGTQPDKSVENRIIYAAAKPMINKAILMNFIHSSYTS